MPRRYLAVGLFLLANFAFGQIKIDGVLNAASGTSSLAPGTWVAIYGANLAPGTVVASAVPFPTSLGGTQVTVGGKSAPLSYVSPTQINMLIPFEAATLNPGQTATVPLVITWGTQTSPAVSLRLARSAPAIFTRNVQGFGPALAFDASFREISSVNGGPIVIYATGLGPTFPAASSAATGATAEPLNRVLSAVTVMVGDTAVTPSFVGLAPFLHGIYQINFTPPVAQPATLSLQVDGAQSNLTTLQVAPGVNTTNVTARLDGIYPATAGAAPPDIAFSAMLLAASLQVSFDITPGAKPFQLVARGPAGGSTINFNPAAGTFDGFSVVPTASARSWNFSASPFIVRDFLQCTATQCVPFPGNVIPRSRVDPAATIGLSTLSLPNAPLDATNGKVLFSGKIPANGRVVIGDGGITEPSRFGGFLNLTRSPGASSATFDLYLDNVPLASKNLPFTVQ